MSKRKILFFCATLFALCLIGSYCIYHRAKLQTTMPVLYITMGEDEAFFEKEFSTASVTIDYPTQLTTENLSMQIRLRGNGSYLVTKKSYKIKLDEKADLLLGASDTSDAAERDWVLIADYFDRSNLRNYYTFLIGDTLDNLAFVPDCMLVEVYLDGAYQGVYLLCEEVEVSDARVDIDDEAETDKGFLVELRSYQKQDYSVTIETDDDTMLYDIRSQIDTEADVERIEALLQAAQDAIESGDQAAIAAVIDLDSCVDMYLLQEFVMNLDVGFGSFYLYCEAGEDILRFGPPWDFDRTMGMDIRTFEGSYMGLYVGASEITIDQQHPWYILLMQQEWFQDLVRARWNETKDGIYAGIDTIEYEATRYKTQLQANYQLWRVDLGEYISCTTYAGGSHSEDTDFLLWWLRSRYDWLDDYFNNVM